MLPDWMANVTLILKSETKTFECSASCKRVVDAEHSAASEALKFLNKNREALIGNDLLLNYPRDSVKILLYLFHLEFKRL